MSHLRPTYRDRLERDYLALAQQRSDLDEKLVELQKELERIETPRLPEGMAENGPRRDALALVPESLVSIGPDDFAASIDGALPDEVAEMSAMLIDWPARCRRLTAMLIGVLRRVAYAKHRPRLEAFAGLFALGVDCDSMRTVATSEHVSLEWVSQKTEEVRRRYNLPMNHHNKSAQAVESYRSSAKLQGMAS